MVSLGKEKTRDREEYQWSVVEDFTWRQGTWVSTKLVKPVYLVVPAPIKTRSEPVTRLGVGRYDNCVSSWGRSIKYKILCANVDKDETPHRSRL